MSLGMCVSVHMRMCITTVNEKRCRDIETEQVQVEREVWKEKREGENGAVIISKIITNGQKHR